MRPLYTLLLFLVSTISYAQEVTTTFHKIHTQAGSTLNDHPLVKKIEDSDFYRNIYYDTILNNIKIYRLEEYYSKTNKPKVISYITRPQYPFKYFLEKQNFYENGNLESLIKYNISGMPIDTAFYLYPNQTLKMITYRNPKRDNVVSDKSLEYIVYYDENQNVLLKNGNGKIKFVHSSRFPYYEEGNMVNSYKHSMWTGEYKGYKFEEIYEHGKLISGKSFQEDGKIVAYDLSTYHVNPEYPQGMNNLRSYITRNYEYPTEAVKQRITGTIELEFIVNKEGDITDVRLIKDLGFGTGEAAERLVRTFGKWKPGSIRGIPQEVTYRLPILLNLPD